MGKVYDSQRMLNEAPSTLAEALAVDFRELQGRAADSLRELEEAVRTGYRIHTTDCVIVR